MGPWAGSAPVGSTQPAGCGAPLQESDRLEWTVGDPGDPAWLVEDFLAAKGFPVRDLTRGRPHAATDRTCGAALLISAEAAGQFVGGRRPTVPPPDPTVAVPDVVVVVYEHRSHPGANQPARDTPMAAPDRQWRLDPWSSSWSEEQHADAVSTVRTAIARGDVYQVNLVGHASAGYHGDPVPALRRVAALPGARYGALLTGSGWAMACASPETLVEVVDGRVVTRPIKGTRPATTAGRAELLASAKERAEHVMIVDLERNDLAMVAVTGSVRVDQLYSLRRWCGLWQAESVISAQLAAGTGLAALLRAVCPGGSVTGAPKLAALEVIAALEPVGRGPSMGAFGWLDSGRIDLGLTIRTVLADTDRLHVWAGGGITWGSEPAAEVAEAAAKAAPLRAALAG